MENANEEDLRKTIPRCRNGPEAAKLRLPLCAALRVFCIVEVPLRLEKKRLRQATPQSEEPAIGSSDCVTQESRTQAVTGSAVQEPSYLRRRIKK